MTQNNTTFIRGRPTWANACVGNNGLPGYWDYAIGFSQAAKILIDVALRGRGLDHSVDELVYPVCFNMRHSVELRLKGAISELILIESRKGHTLEFDLAGSHDIGNIWRFFVQKSQLTDDRYAPIIELLDKKIRDIAEIDATGQTFRYALNTESQKHLVDVAIINFVVLKDSFSVLEEALNDLHKLNKYLRDEYEWGTFTKTLSRKNLFDLTSQLPPRSKWTDDSFSATKSKIKKTFEIGSKELTESIRCIEAHFELAPLIGISVPLLGLVEGDITEFFGHWFKQHNLPSDTDPIDYETSEWGSESLLDILNQDALVQEEVWEAVQPNLTPEVLAGFSALYYFARQLDFSELYRRIYENDLREAEAAFVESEDAVSSQFFHIFDKTNAVYNMLRSLYFLRKSEAADQLVTAYGLDKKFSWLNEAQSRELFRKPGYCGYAI